MFSHRLRTSRKQADWAVCFQNSSYLGTPCTGHILEVHPMEHILTLRTASLAVLRSSPAPEGSVVSKLTSEGGFLGTRFSLKECNHTPMNQEELK